MEPSNPDSLNIVTSISSGPTSRRLPQVSEEAASDTYSMQGFNNKNIDQTHERMKKRGINLGKR